MSTYYTNEYFAQQYNGSYHVGTIRGSYHGTFPGDQDQFRGAYDRLQALANG